MDGAITLTSTPGKGSTFTVTLPLMVGSNTQLEQKPAPPKEAAKSQSEHKVLLVEDYAANILVAGTYLESFGYACDVAENGYEAIEKARTGTYLAILMDVQMNGINGFETTRLIHAQEAKESKPRTPIIGMTAHALTGDGERCMAVDMDDYLSKPYNPDVLEEKLAYYTRQIASPNT